MRENHEAAEEALHKNETISSSQVLPQSMLDVKEEQKYEKPKEEEQQQPGSTEDPTQLQAAYTNLIQQEKLNHRLKQITLILEKHNIPAGIQEDEDASVISPNEFMNLNKKCVH